MDTALDALEVSGFGHAKLPGRRSPAPHKTYPLILRRVPGGGPRLWRYEFNPNAPAAINGVEVAKATLSEVAPSIYKFQLYVQDGAGPRLVYIAIRRNAFCLGLFLQEPLNPYNLDVGQDNIYIDIPTEVPAGPEEPEAKQSGVLDELTAIREACTECPGGKFSGFKSFSKVQCLASPHPCGCVSLSTGFCPLGVWDRDAAGQVSVTPVRGNTRVADVIKLISGPDQKLWPHGGHKWANVIEAHRRVFRQAIDSPPLPPEPSGQRGILMVGGGRYFASAYVTVRVLRHVGCTLPIEMWHLGEDEMPPRHRKLLAELGVTTVDALEVRKIQPARRLGGWELKAYASLHCSFDQFIFMDADCYPTEDPTFLFEHKDFVDHGSLFWPDGADRNLELWQNAAFGLKHTEEPAFESGQFVMDRLRCWRELYLTKVMNDHSDWSYRFVYGDKDTFRQSWRLCGRTYGIVQGFSSWDTHTILQYHPDAPNVGWIKPEDRRVLFQHRARSKFTLEKRGLEKDNFKTSPQRDTGYNPRLAHEDFCFTAIRELGDMLDGELKPRIAVATNITPEIESWAREAADRKADYCRQHGYSWVDFTDLDPSRSATWGKITTMLETVPQYDWVFWTDADAVIMNHNRQLEDFIDDDYDLVLTRDHNGFNAGNFLARNTPATLDFLQRVWDHGPLPKTPTNEQTVMSRIMDLMPKLRVKWVPQDTFNAYRWQFPAGSFLVHFAGSSMQERPALMKEWLAKAA